MILRQYAPILLDPMRVGEIDGRAVYLTADLGPVGDQVPSLGTVTVTISRQDGFAIGAGDLILAGSDWPISLDPTGLIVTIGLNAQTGSAGVSYLLTLTVDRTMQNRLFIRDLTLAVLPLMG